ncbi:MAG: hypothetical protein PUF03_01355 [Lachnospiraceae bacterium]|nr:hypothetical protein [Lachnospiraceae bacterium]
MAADEEEILWQSIDIWKGQIYLEIPQEFMKPSVGEVEKIFPYDLKPQKIWMASEGQKILTFNLLEKQLQEEQVEDAIGAIGRFVHRAYPESIQESARRFKTEAGIIGWFSFLTGGIKDDHYHIMFIMSVNGRMMLGSYHFPVAQTEQERITCFKIFESIQIHRESERTVWNAEKSIFGQDNSIFTR